MTNPKNPSRDATRSRPRLIWSLVCAAALACSAQPARATDIIGIMNAALDQPQINAYITYSPTGDPLAADFYGYRSFNIQGYFDTGASGVLLSKNTFSYLNNDLFDTGVGKATYNSKRVYFEDVGVAGADRFETSINLHVALAPYVPHINDQIAIDEETLSNTGTFSGINLSYYNQKIGPIRAQVGPLGDSDPTGTTGDLDVLGMPLMKGKVIVMDPKPVENIISGNLDNGYNMKTYVYNPGTPFKTSTLTTDPGIPTTTRSIKLSYGAFDAFTRVGTENATDPTKLDAVPAGTGPTLEHNPFIGPNPVNPTGDTTPPVKISFNNKSTTGSFLLDTGAAASMISTTLASQLNVRYIPATDPRYDAEKPQLETFNPASPATPGTLVPDQYLLSIGGIGGTKRVAGFFLSSFLVKTLQGGAADTDPRHLNFIDAPVLVTDITMKDDKGTPSTADDRILTLDGIFGMNMLVPSAYTEEDPGGIIPIIGNVTPGAFDWIVFDEPNGLLNVRPRLNGDSNRDGIIDINDLVAVAQNYMTDITSGSYNEQGDINGDGTVNFDDLVAVAQHYQDTDLQTGDVINLPHYDFNLYGITAVPEPSGLLALAAAAALLLTPRRRSL